MAGVFRAGMALPNNDDMTPSSRKPKKADVYTAEMGPPPTEPDDASASKKKVVKKAKGGYVRAADGIAKRGKTRGKMV